MKYVYGRYFVTWIQEAKIFFRIQEAKIFFRIQEAKKNFRIQEAKIFFRSQEAKIPDPGTQNIFQEAKIWIREAKMAEFLLIFRYLGEGYIYQFQELFFKDRFVPYKYKPIKELSDNFFI